MPEQLSKTIETLYRSESGRILATLVRLLGDLDLAEEAMHEAFAAALDTWPQTGIPENPRPWLISTARFKAIDAMRQRARFDAAQRDPALRLEARINEASHEDEEIEDDRLRLIFTCCHPVLPPEGQVALTLREVCGLTTEEIARAFLVTPATLAQRIVRAKAVIRDKAIPYQVPDLQELSARLGAVLQVVYLIFNEGYSAEATRAELSCEAIRLGRLLLDLLPEPEVMGLLGLMLLQESRRAARISPEGDLILLDHQNRALWNRDQIAEGISLTESALARAVSAPTRCRRPLRQSMPMLPPPHLRTGGRSRHSTTGCCASSHLRLWNSTAPLQSPCARGRRRAFALSTTCSNVANSLTTISRTLPGRNCAGGWDGFRRLVLRMRRRCHWSGRSPSADF